MVLGSRVRQTEFKSAPKASNLDEQLTSIASAFHLLNGNKKYPPHRAIVVTEYGSTYETLAWYLAHKKYLINASYYIIIVIRIIIQVNNNPIIILPNFYNNY